MVDETERWAQVAKTAVAGAMELARKMFGGTIGIEPKGPRGDIVTEVDRAAERLILDLLKTEFPAHGVLSEEAGAYGSEAEYEWLVDPLDGTNNYAYGLPTYGAAVTLCHRGEPILAALGEGHSGSIACAVAGGGVTIDGKPVERPVRSAHSAPANALWIGYQSEHDKRLAGLTDMLHAISRRVFSTWAPTIDVFLYLRGGLDAITIYQCSGTELLGSLLVMKEAGATLSRPDGVVLDSLDGLPELSFAGEFCAVRRLVTEYQRTEAP
ncbi:inositol monophosphatase family protein [Actinocorallia lasiicapitis]